MKKLNKILLIDDDEITNYINKDLLEGLNIATEVQVIEDGAKAYNFLTNCTESGKAPCPEFVIFDHRMPNMDGKELMVALDEINFIEDNKIVFMYLGANPTQEHIKELKTLGVQEFTIKPLSERKIMEVYRKYWYSDAN